jgi:hypothetical protein
MNFLVVKEDLRRLAYFKDYIDARRDFYGDRIRERPDAKKNHRAIRRVLATPGEVSNSDAAFCKKSFGLKFRDRRKIL